MLEGNMGIEGTAVQTVAMDQIPLLERPRIILEGATVNHELHELGRAMLTAKGLDPSLGDLIIGDSNPQSKCTGGSIAEALAMGHGGLDRTLEEAMVEAREEGVNPDVAAFRSIRAFVKRDADPETGVERLLSVGLQPEDNSQDSSAQANLKKNIPG